jgi:hypothetical protein
MEESNKPYLLVIFGKDECPRCARLERDVREVLEEDRLTGAINLDYQNLSTVEGMVAYAKAETVNGQRIPALQLLRYDTEENAYSKIPDKRDECFDEKKGRLFVPVYLQLETDYSSDEGITKGEIRELLDLAGAS